MAISTTIITTITKEETIIKVRTTTIRTTITFTGSSPKTPYALMRLRVSRTQLKEVFLLIVMISLYPRMRCLLLLYQFQMNFYTTRQQARLNILI